MLPVLDISCQVVLQNAEKNALELNQAQIGTDALLLTLLTVARKRWMKTYFQLCVCVCLVVGLLLLLLLLLLLPPLLPPLLAPLLPPLLPPRRTQGIHLHIHVCIHENNMIYIHLLTSKDGILYMYHVYLCKYLYTLHLFSIVEIP